MKRKTVSNILKGVATAGVVLGGANLADEIGVVYAEELSEVKEPQSEVEQEASASDSYREVISQSEVNAKNHADSANEANSQSLANDSAAESAASSAAAKDSENEAAASEASEVTASTSESNDSSATQSASVAKAESEEK